MPLFLRIDVVSAKSGSYEDIADGEVTRQHLLSFDEDDERVLEAWEAAFEAAAELEPDQG